MTYVKVCVKFDHIRYICFYSRVPYKEIFGGVVALTKRQFQLVNGYSNRFFHWGGEDDDMYSRSVSMDISQFSISFL